MKIKLTEKNNNLVSIDGVMLLCNQLGFELSENGTEIEIENCEEGFSVFIDEKKKEIKYNKLNDFYRAFAIAIYTLKNNECINISQKSSFETCGMMLDVSRRAALKVDTIKDIMLKMACMGLNRLMLYSEDMYELANYPYFGYMRGRYSKDELKEIVSFGNILGIETVPCIQTLAHLANALRWDDFSDVKDTWDILLVGEEKTYALIEEMIKTMRECFTSSNIHIGMDEAPDLGLGKYLDINGYKNRFEILCEHFSRVAKIAEKYDFKPMMWSDMVFTLMNISEENANVSASLPENFSKDVAQVYWDYYNRSEKQYDARAKAHEELNCPVVFAGGIWTWSGPSVNYVQTFYSTLPALKVCKAHGIRHVFATLWGDDGAECDIYEGLYGMQLYAEINYNQSLSDSELKRMFKICTGFDSEAFLALDTENYYNKPCTVEITKFDDETYLDGILTFSKQVLYQNPMLGLFDKNFEGVDLKSHYVKTYEKFCEIDVPKGLEKLYEYHRMLLKILTAKCDVGIRIKKAYDEKNMRTLSEIVNELENMTCDIEKLYNLRAALWYQNNKPFGFEAVGNRIMSVVAMTKNAGNRIRGFIKGEVASLAELEEDRLYFNSKEKPFVCEFISGRIMMP